MTDKKLAILAIAAVIMAGWAILQSRLAQQAGTSGLFQRAPLIQGLAIDAIAEITLAAGDEAETLTLKKTDGRFRVMEKDGYPAKVSEINLLLNTCLDIRVSRPTTSNPANHADLGVTDQTAQYAVRFRNAAGEEIIGVLVSDRQTEPEGAYVRLTTAPETYFVDNPPWLSAAPMSYLDTTLVETNRSKTRQVTVRGPKGDYVLDSADGTTITLEAMPANKQFKGTAYQSVFGALGTMRFEDVMAAQNAPEGLVFDHSVVCRMEDSTVYTVRLAKADDKTYATLSAEFLDKSPVQVGQTESEEELKKKEAKLLAMDAAQAFAQRHQGWVYLIPSFKAEDLTKPLDDLLEEKPEPADAPSETDNDATASEAL